MKKNVASQVIGAQLISKTDGSAITTGTTTIYVTGDGGTQAAGSVGSGACTHEGNGYWTYVPAQAETNYDQIGFTFVNTAACNVTVQVFTTFPQTVDNATNISAIKTKTDSLTFTVAGQVDANTLKIGGTTQTARDIGASVLLSSGTGTGQISLSSGLVTLAAVTHTGAVIPTVTTTTTATNLTNAPTSGDFTATMKTSIGTAVAASAVASVTAGVTVTTNNDKTGYTIASGGIPSGAHAAAELNNIADAMLDRNMATGTDSGTDSTVVRTTRQALRAIRNKVSISGGTVTVTKEDDATASWTGSVATAAGNPISSVDPT